MALSVTLPLAAAALWPPTSAGNYINKNGGADGYFLRKADFGVVAQDVQAVFPLAVRTREDGQLAVDYEKLCALAFAAIKELKIQIDQLKNP